MPLDIQNFISDLDIPKLLRESEMLRQVNSVKKDTGKIITIPVNIFLEVLSKDIVSDIGNNFDLESSTSNLWINFDPLLNNKNLSQDEKFLLEKDERDIIVGNIYKTLILFLYYQEESDNELDFLKYVNKKIKLVEKIVSKKITLNGRLGIAKGISVELNIKDLFNFQEEIMKYLTSFLPFINNFQVFLGENIDYKFDGSLNKNITLGELNNILLDISNIFVNKNISDEFRESLIKIIKILQVFIKLISYLHQIKDDNFFEELTYEESDLGELKITGYQINGNENNPSIIEFGGILVLLTYGLQKMDSLSLNKMEEDSFGGLYNISFLKKINSSKIKDEFELIKSLDKKRILFEVISKRPKLFLNRKNIPFSNLFTYLKGNLSNEKYDNILKFFGENHIDYNEEEYLFIFENNLENTAILEDKKFLKKTILWFDIGVSLIDIKKLTKKDFEVLLAVDDIKEIKFLIKSFLEDNNCSNNYEEFIEKIKSIKDDLSFLHKFADGYIELEELSNSEFKYIELESFKSEIETVHVEYNLIKIINRNKKILSGKKYNIIELNEFYILFNDLDKKNLEELLVGIFTLNKDDFKYIKNILFGFKGNKNVFERLSTGGYIEFILKHMDLIDLYLEEENADYSLGYLLDEIDEENGLMLFRKKKKNDTYQGLSLYYNNDDINIIKSMFNNKVDIDFIIKIGKSLNGFKDSFIVWLKTKETIDSKTLENIFFILHFFQDRNIKSFNRIKKVFEFVFNLNGETDKLEYIKNKFKDFKNIEDTEEFKGVILKYLKNGDESIINEYLLNHNQDVEIIANNELDNFILSILKEGSDEEKENLGVELSTIVLYLVNNLTSSILSSKINNDSGTGTGTSTNLIKQYYLRELLKSNNESYINYVYRIHKINWRMIIHFKKGDNRGRKIIQNLYHSSLDNDYLFFDAFEKFGEIITTFDDIDGGIDISNLLDTYNRLFNEAVKIFKRELNI